MVVRIVMRTIAMVVIVALVVVGLSYRRQIVSYLTHWKGSPTHTTPYVAFPAGSRPDVRIAALGDTGDSGKRLGMTASAIERIESADPLNALLLLGDNVYPSGDPARLKDLVFKPFSPVLERGVDLFAVLGNHDVKKAHADAQMKALGMPGRWWSSEVGELLLVGLDSNEPDNVVQQNWLREILATSTARWKIVALHHPPYSAGYQGSSVHVREVFSPIFERYGVQLVLSGHDHDYQRSKPINGVTYIVSGAGSGSRRTSTRSFTAVSFSWHHFVVLDIFPDRLVGRAVNQKGRVADEFTLH